MEVRPCRRELFSQRFVIRLLAVWIYLIAYSLRTWVTMRPLQSLLSVHPALPLRQFTTSLSTRICRSSLSRSIWQLSRPSFRTWNPLSRLATSTPVSGNEGILGNVLGRVSAQVRGMKTRSSVKRLCDGCKVRVISGGNWGMDLRSGSRNVTLRTHLESGQPCSLPQPLLCAI